MWIQSFHGGACDLQQADMLIIKQAASAASTDDDGKLSFGPIAWNVIATFPNKAEGMDQMAVTQHETQEDAEEQITKFKEALNELSSEVVGYMACLVDNVMPLVEVDRPEE